jgi:hypothetical protein
MSLPQKKFNFDKEEENSIRINQSNYGGASPGRGMVPEKMGNTTNNNQNNSVISMGTDNT